MENQKKERNSLEKITFVIGLIILVLLVGYLSYQWSTRKEQPPKLEISAFFEPSLPQNTYKVEITNNGQETAQSVNIQFDLYQEGKLSESAVMELDYVPVKSKEEGWISFSHKRMSSDSLVVGTRSFLKP